MRRRDFVILVGGVASAFTCANGLAAKVMARIGLLALALPKDLQLPDLLTPALNALGWREGETCQIEARSANGDIASLPRLAAELVALRPDILIGIGSGETKALQSATSEIPILFIMSSDPVGYGLVDSIARPGRNTAGTSITPQILWGKRLELTAELLGHQPTKVAWIGNPDEVSAKRNLAVLMQSAEKLGVKVERLEVRKPHDLDRVFVTATGCEAILVQFVTLTLTYRRQIAELAILHRLPSIYEVRDYVDAGGLISYGTDTKENFRLTARYVDRILKGDRPRDLPVIEASRFELVINIKTAKSLGLTVPPTLLARADEVVE
jgi:putative ABC transport system substrate-binding protein